MLGKGHGGQIKLQQKEWKIERLGGEEEKIKFIDLGLERGPICIRMPAKLLVNQLSLERKLPVFCYISKVGKFWMESHFDDLNIKKLEKNSLKFNKSSCHVGVDQLDFNVNLRSIWIA